MEKKRKVVVLGFRAVGKSSVTLQFIEQQFSDIYNPTIENSFRRKFKVNGQDYNVEVLDTAGQDEYSLFQPQYALGVDGYVLVYSVTSRSSFETIRVINEKILNFAGTDKVPRVLVGNKRDVPVSDRQVSTDDGKALAAELGCPFLECSAKHNENINETFSTLVVEIDRQNGVLPPEKDSGCCIL